MIALPHPRTWPVWELLFPPFCAVCGRALEPDAVLYCASCWADAPLVETHELPKLKHVDQVRAAFRYGGDTVVKASVHALKYDRLKRVAGAMAQYLLPQIPVSFFEPRIVWTTVPLHWLRRLNRGFNQSDLLAAQLVTITNHAALVPLLRRTRNTPSQTARSYRERSANIKNAFALRSDRSVPKSVLLIDDVITTGATVDECARVLKDAGAEWVGALSFGLTSRT